MPDLTQKSLREGKTGRIRLSHFQISFFDLTVVTEPLASTSRSARRRPTVPETVGSGCRTRIESDGAVRRGRHGGR